MSMAMADGWTNAWMIVGMHTKRLIVVRSAWYAGTHGLFRTLWLQTIMGELSTVDLATNAVLVRVVLIRTVRYEHSQGFIFRVMSFFPISYRRLTRYTFN
jgi:hypothetical protein